MALFFFLVPYEIERRARMRVPWVTFCVMLACAGTFVLSYNAQQSKVEGFDKALDNAVHYAARSPAVDTSLLTRLCHDVGEPTCMDRAAATEVGGGSSQPKAVTAPAGSSDPIPVAQQLHLDRLTSDAREAWEAEPWVAMGLTRKPFKAHGLFAMMLVHSGVPALLISLLMLWLLMSAIENLYNRWLTLTIYLLSGVAAGGLQLLLHTQHPSMPLLGASGAIAGLAGTYLVLFGSRRYRLWSFLWLPKFRKHFLHTPTWLVLTLWLLLLVLGWLVAGELDLAHIAQLGGLPVGLLGGLLLARTRPAHGVVEDDRAEEKRPLISQARSAAERGEQRTAVRLFRKLVEQDPDDDDLKVELATAINNAGNRDESSEMFRELICRLLKDGRAAAAVRRYQEMGQVTGDAEMPPDETLALADQFLVGRMDHYALYTYERYLDSYPAHHNRVKALLAATGLLVDQPEGRERAVELLAEAESLTKDPGDSYYMRRIEELRASLHQMPSPHESKHEELEKQAEGLVKDDELARNIEDWVKTPVQPRKAQAAPLSHDLPPGALAPPAPSPVEQSSDPSQPKMTEPMAEAIEPFIPPEFQEDPMMSSTGVPRTEPPVAAPEPLEAAPEPEVAPEPEAAPEPVAPPEPPKDVKPADDGATGGDGENPDDDGNNRAKITLIGAPLFTDDPTVKDLPTTKEDDGELTIPTGEMAPIAADLPSRDPESVDPTSLDDTSPWTPPGRRDPTTSGEFYAEDALPDESCTTMEEGPPGSRSMEIVAPDLDKAYILQSRQSVLTLIEPKRLNFENAFGAPFKVPLERVSWLGVATIARDERAPDRRDSLVCDLVHAIHHTPFKMLVETVRLRPDHLPYGMLLPSAGMDDNANFFALIKMLEPKFPDVQYLKDELLDKGAFPYFDTLEAYERALLERIAGDP